MAPPTPCSSRFDPLGPARRMPCRVTGARCRLPAGRRPFILCAASSCTCVWHLQTARLLQPGHHEFPHFRGATFLERLGKTGSGPIFLHWLICFPVRFRGVLRKYGDWLLRRWNYISPYADRIGGQGCLWLYWGQRHLHLCSFHDIKGEMSGDYALVENELHITQFSEWANPFDA